jgi:hypothetical protein
MEPVSPPRARVAERGATSPGRAGSSVGAGAGGPPGEPPPLPCRIGMTGWWWLGLGTIAILLWAVAVTHGGGMLLGVD